MICRRKSLVLPIVLGVCWVSATLSGPAATAHESADATVPSFHNDVVPILTRYGCNSGGCHGKLSGQRGFRLSLRGYAPELDFEWITREGRGRRINPAAPELSLLLRKAIGELPHGGGRRFEPDSAAYQTLANWIRNGSPRPTTDEPRVERVVISPTRQTLKIGDQVALHVVAHYSDQSQRDVTTLAQFDSNDPGQISVSATGEVQALRHGETVVRVAFQGLVEVATFTVPFPTATQPAWYPTHQNAIDGPVMNKLAALRIEPSPLCDDATFLRRASLDAIGTLPTADELRAFLSDARPNKRQLAIDQLLERAEFVDFWTLQLCDLLQNRKERDHDVRGAKGVRSFHAWVRRQVAANRPWHEIARDVLTATGSSFENPAVGYFVVTVGEKEAVQSEVADSVAQSFLGTRIGCARCHNHPLEKYTQDDYYHFAAFFSRLTLARQDPQNGPTSLLVGTRQTQNLEKQIGEQQKKIADMQSAATASDSAHEKKLADANKRLLELQKQLTEALRQPAQAHQPRTNKQLAARPLDRSDTSLEPGADPRKSLVDWMTQPTNDAFAGAMVNRLWKHFFAVALVEPVDDLRATNPPSNAELWQLLLREFTQHGYDLKHLMRLILNSRTYQLAADTRPSNAQDTKFYSHYYARRLSAEVLLDAICQVTDEPETFAGYPRGLRAIQVPDSGADSYFLTLFGRSPRVTACACERENDVTLPQLLHLQNGDVGKKILASTARLPRLLQTEADNRRVTEELFLVTLGRLPTSSEAALIGPDVASAAERQEAFADLQWALLNAKEFAFNH